MARSRTPKFDASEVITNEIIRIIERGVLPWRKPWTAGGSSRPLRVGGEPYQGVNNFLLKLPDCMAQVFSDKVRGDVVQVNLMLLQIGKELTRIEAIIVNDGRAVTLPMQGVAKL